MWTFHLPPLQPSSPASLVAQTLHRIVGPDSLADFVYVDFCSGAGGPVAVIAEKVNGLSGPSASHVDLRGVPEGASYAQAAKEGREANSRADSDARGQVLTETRNPQANSIDFVLTDIAPHIQAWEDLAARPGSFVRYVPRSVDASAAPSNLLDLAIPANRTPSGAPAKDTDSLPPSPTQKTFRLFNLAFHHFDDELATAIMRDTLRTSAGFGIFELQARTISSFLVILLMGPLLLVLTPFYFYNDPIHLFFTFVIPIVPFVVVFDGIVSSIRTRTGAEVKKIAERVLDEETRAKGNRDGARIEKGEWNIMYGNEWHTWPIGVMGWVIGIRKANE